VLVEIWHSEEGKEKKKEINTYAALGD